MAVSNTEIISNRYHIASLLQRACTSHAIISLQRPHEQFIYNSTILALNNDEYCFTIDAPADSQIPLYAKPGDWLKFRIKLQGLVLSFEAIIEGVLDDAISFHRYQLHLPSQVNYQQRRGAFRANVGYQFNASFTARLDEQQQISGRLTDLSLAGASVELTALHQLKPQTPLSHCKLQLASDSIIIAASIIRTIQMTEHSLDIYHLGVEFIDLSASEHRSLQRWVMKFDRESRKSAFTE